MEEPMSPSPFTSLYRNPLGQTQGGFMKSSCSLSFWLASATRVVLGVAILPLLAGLAWSPAVAQNRDRTILSVQAPVGFKPFTPKDVQEGKAKLVEHYNPAQMLRL